MQINKKVFPLMTISLPNGMRSRIDTNPDFQRPSVWSLSQKQLLIDTILRGYDIPKMYWRKVGTNPDAYEVVDGQQRPKPARIIDLTHKESKYKQTSLFTHLRPKRKSHLCIDSDSEEELTYEVDSKS